MSHSTASGLSLLLFLATFLAQRARAELQLVSVQSVFRHGDRAPSAPYPLDPHPAAEWPRGLAQLTAEGAAQTQALGRFYAQHYGQTLGLFKDNNSVNLNDTSTLDRVRMRSSSKQRAVESAQNVLLGLAHEQVPIDVPVHYKQDLLLKPNSVPCARYDRILAQESAQLFAKYDLAYRTEFEEMSRFTGLNLSMASVDKLFDAVFRETVHGMKQPSWLQKPTVDVFTGRPLTFYSLVLELKRVQRLAQFNTAEKAKLRTGFLLGQLLNNLLEAAHNENGTKLQLYSSVRSISFLLKFIIPF